MEITEFLSRERLFCRLSSSFSIIKIYFFPRKFSALYNQKRAQLKRGKIFQKDLLEKIFD